MPTRVMSTCSVACQCGWRGHATLYFLEADQHKNNFKCEKCGKDCETSLGGAVADTKTFPFTTTHLDGNGTPIEVNSLYHLRQLEKQYGVAAMHNSEESGTHELPQHRQGGRDFADRDDRGSRDYFRGGRYAQR